MTATTAIRYRVAYDKLIGACTDLVAGREQKAKSAVEELVLEEVRVDTPNEALLSHIVATALMRRIDRRLLASKNIYLDDFDVPQIVLFYKMLEAYPQVAASHVIANQFLMRALRGRDAITIFDIGIGKGKQVAGLLRSAAEQGVLPKRVHVVGLDPDPANVFDSGRLMEEIDSQVSGEIRYHPICALLEDLGSDQLYSIKRLSRTLLVNSAYTMHHSAHAVGDVERRTGYFQLLRALEPRLLTLVEPSSDHDEEGLERRLHNCWTHFSTVFDLVDRSSIEPEHKFLVKRKFFGREIDNIFGVSDHLRSERHEPMESWLLRLAKAGFRTYPYRDVQVDLPDYCDWSLSEGVASLGYESVPLVGVFAVEPD